jgi:cytochrome c556
VIKSCFCAAIIAAALPLTAHAQFAKPEEAVKYRQSALSLMGTHFSRIGAVVRGAAPFDAQQVQDNAALVQTMSVLPWQGFVAGTDKGVPTRAKPEIWSDSAKFKTAQDNMIKAVANLSAVSKSGNLDQVKTAFGDAGRACKACHDDFRKD